MATVLKEVDAVTIGVGFTGSILARELTKAGLKVVGLERGANRSAHEDFTLPSVRDDLKYAIRQELFQDTAAGDGVAAPFAVRDGAADPPSWLVPAGHGRWRRRRALEWRHLAAPAERSQSANAPGKPLRQDRDPGGHDDPGLRRSPTTSLSRTTTGSRSCAGISGKAGNLRGKKIEGGNVFEGPRQNEYPNQAARQDHGRDDHGEGGQGAWLSSRSRRRPRI